MDVAKASATAQEIAQAIFSAMLPPGDCAVRSATLPMFRHQKEAAMSIARELSEAALNIRYDNLPAEVIRETKRLILDALSCAIGAFDAEPCRICREVAREHGGAGVATLIGERDKVSVSQAIIANETMVRYLDFNDVLYFPKSPGKIGGAH